jgi:hypothetical protein
MPGVTLALARSRLRRPYLRCPLRLPCLHCPLHLLRLLPYLF